MCMESEENSTFPYGGRIFTPCDEYRKRTITQSCIATKGRENMPISVKDIQEKEFSRQKRDGYNIEEVDDFLDEIYD